MGLCPNGPVLGVGGGWVGGWDGPCTLGSSPRPPRSGRNSLHYGHSPTARILPKFPRRPAPPPAQRCHPPRRIKLPIEPHNHSPPQLAPKSRSANPRIFLPCGLGAWKEFFFCPRPLPLLYFPSPPVQRFDSSLNITRVVGPVGYRFGLESRSRVARAKFFFGSATRTVILINLTPQRLIPRLINTPKANLLLEGSSDKPWTVWAGPVGN